MDDFRAASLQGWASVASDWGELIANVDRQLARAAEWMLETVALAPGERVLELAGGPGTISLLASRAVGEEGSIICTDFAEPMVETAKRRAAAEGAQNVECRVMDAEAIDLPDGCVDVVLCRMGYMLMPDPGTALREAARVLKDGGRVALAVWSEPAANPWAAMPMRAITQHLNAPPPPPGAPGLWALADEEHLRRLLGDAGFDSVRTELLDDVIHFDSAEAWIAITARLAAPVRALFANLDDAARAAIIQSAATQAESYRQADGTLALPERMLVAGARRSA